MKFTTARLVAEKTLSRIFADKNPLKEFQDETFSSPQDAKDKYGIFDFDWRPESDGSKWKDALQSLIREESVQHLDDLIFRRTTLWENPERPMRIGSMICDLLDWDDSRCSKEIKRLNERMRDCRIS